MKSQEIKQLIEQRDYEQALTACEKALSETPEQKIDVLRLRAEAFAIIGDYEKAIADYETIIAQAPGAIRDYYLAAFNCLSLNRFERARELYEVVLRLGREQNELWFESPSNFYLSYVQMELEDYDKALIFLGAAAQTETDLALPIPDIGMCSEQQLRQEIQRRKQAAS
jgi:tetratricopeptide (TPR) repeat protein